MPILSGINRRVRRFLTGLIVPTVTDFHEEPVEGMVVVRNDIMYICRLWMNQLVWNPVVNVKHSAKFEVTTAARFWTFTHRLGQYVIASAYRSDGRVLRIRKITNVIDADPTQYTLRVDMGRYQRGTLVVFATTDNISEYEIVPIEVTAGQIASLAKLAYDEIDAAAEDQRLRLLTPGSGQALEYVSTSRELDIFAKDPAPDPANYPYLAADIGVLGADINEVAANIKAIDDQWQQVGARIKKLRREAKAAVAAAAEAEDVAGIEAAKNVDWSQIYNV